MNKNNGINGKILTGWLLLLLFTLPPATKNIHICQCICVHDIEHEENHNHTHHDCDSCVICQFVLFPFIKTESTEFIYAVQTLYSKLFAYQKNTIPHITYNYMLRAPPTGA
ncbi:MAG: hypothetical protein LBS55_01435 [Prevotellaceae bacterium]|jgi:hypothetical protein|nr:hypothetical protein [Prevotellaceae bacterium]